MITIQTPSCNLVATSPFIEANGPGERDHRRYGVAIWSRRRCSLRQAISARYNRSVKATRTGELGLIERLTDILRRHQTPSAPKPLVGIGDDCAAWTIGDCAVLATTDTMVHGVHFSNAIAWQDVGWKIVAVNVSDIAAMGGTPTYGLITLGVPPDLASESLEELYEGVAEASLRYGLTIAGGDVVEAAQAFVTLTLFGEAATDSSGRPLLTLRSAAHPGDVIAVTGRLGDSAAGLRLLSDQGGRIDAKYAVLVQAHVRPEPRIEVGRNAVNRGVRCAIDISDGLLQDIGHICEASGVAALIRAEQLPVSEPLRAAFPSDAVSLAATGGEDYELVLVARRNVLDEVTKASGVPITIVGEVTVGPAGDVRLIDAQGTDITPAVGGWDHLRSAR